MKLYKQIEVALNLLLIAAFAIVFAASQDFSLLFTAYFIVGGIQLLSIIVHFVKGWFTGKGSLRIGYYWFLLFVFLFCCVGIGLFFLLFAAPLMALFYTYICYREYKTLELKELVHLK
jgi:hypothetical protein